MRHIHGPSHLDGLGLDWRVLDQNRPVRDSDIPDADLVIATWWETAEWVAKLSPNKGAKAYFIQLDERTVVPDDVSWGHRVAKTWLLPMYKIATSGVVKIAVEKEIKVKNGHIPVVEIGVDIEQFNAAPRNKQLTPRVGFLYETTPRKGPDVALSVAEIVRSKLPRTEFAVLTSSKTVNKAALPAGALLNVQPTTSQLRELYSACDVWLCTSRCEGFHLPPMEAMACRCPVVSTRVGGPIDMIEDGINGFLLNVDDVKGLAERVLEILKLSDLQWRTMSDAAYSKASDYTWEAATIAFEKTLFKAAENSGQLELGRTVGSQ
ncbi:MAG TPA: glycosyltransferase family 4 protein [Tepidisphaeraceae bacterium]|nr:glycosyltransferase family 4 protein [Tepidisphaeraceae bacterium]